MDRLAFTSLKSVHEERIRREMLTNELANINSVGFKRSFELAAKAIKVQGPGFDSRLMPALDPSEQVNLEPGTRMATARMLDVAMDGATVMGVRAPNGDLAFTRRGDLRVNPQGVLENGQGFAILGEDARPINIPAGFDIDVLRDGELFARDPNTPEREGVRVGRIMLRDASDRVMGRRQDGLFKPFGEGVRPNGDFQSGPQVASLTAGVLEGSNVSPIEAMVRMLDQTRSFETQVRIVKEARSLDESGSSMMRAR